MRQIRRLLCIALAFSTSIAGFGKSPSQQAELVHLHLRALNFRHIKITPLDQAFLDAVEILDESNECSQFFGTEATRVLSELLTRLKEEMSNDHFVAFRMSGSFVVYANGNTGARYRLFQNAKVNVNGPFYRSKIFLTDPFVPNVGSFPPNTRQARVLILLHELAHLIQGSDRKWLIPDDGGNAERSRSNTRIVESKCGRQLRAL
jgi:hypothetical protein